MVGILINVATAQMATPTEKPLRENLDRRKAVELSRSRNAGWKSRAVVVQEQASTSSLFRQLALRVRNEMSARNASSLLVTSALAEDGKTLIACNLALAMASISSGQRIALVDLDLRRPQVAESLGIEPTCGIEEVVRGRIPSSLARVHTSDGVDVYPVHEDVQAPHELLARPELGTFLKELASHYPVVVVDSPPFLPVPDGRQLIDLIDTALVVARSGQTPQAAFAAFGQQIPQDKLIGSVLNDHKPTKFEYGPTNYDVGESQGKERTLPGGGRT